jgi:hypothetical protein
LPEVGGCPACGQARPNLSGPPPGPDADRADVRAAVGCGLGGVSLGILAGVEVGILICMGMLAGFMNDLGKLLGGK